jgi:HD-GYP domain-containing protein (c-di-GMP phosphodiesterase class II)
VLAHHERIDGTGYPQALPGEQIPVEARILAVADAYEAMTADRPYRRALPLPEARAELHRCAGTQFDAEIVAVFERILNRTEAPFQATLSAAAAVNAPKSLLPSASQEPRRPPSSSSAR